MAETKAIAVSTFIIATEPLGGRAKDLIRKIWLSATTATSDYYRSAPTARLFGGKDNEFIDDPDPHDRTRPLR